MDTLLFALNAVLPILLLLAFGYILKRVKFLNENFLQIGNKFIFRIALPALLFYTIYSIEDLGDINWPVIIVAVAGVSVLFIIGLILALVTTRNEKRRGVIWQVVFRANYAIIGIPLAQAIGGTPAVAVVALVSAIIVPLINIYAVIALSVFVKDETDLNHPFKSTLLKIVKNPLIIAIFLGLFTLWIRSFIPVDPVTQIPVFTIQNNLRFLYLVIEWVGRTASPLALIILGGTFEFFAVKEMKKEIIVGTFSRAIVAPLIILTTIVILSNHIQILRFNTAEYPALIALFASPVAVSSAIMAREMKNDEKLAVQLVVWTTTLSILSIFITVYVFRYLNLL